jgi:hypothetical protein
LLIITICATLPLAAEVGGVSVGVVLDQNSVAVNLRLELRENLTNLSPAYALSPAYVVVGQSNASAVTGNVTLPLQASIQRLVPTARIDLLQLTARIANTSKQMWLIQENFTIMLSGVSTNSGGMISTDLGFLSMNVSDSMRLGHEEFNTLGVSYLLQTLSALSPGTSYFVDGARFLNNVIPRLTTGKFRALDFSWVPPVSKWTEQADTLRQSTTWKLNPTNSNIFAGGAPYNLTLGSAFREGILVPPIYVATLDPALEVTVPAIARAQGTVVQFDIPLVAEVAMPIIIGASLVAAVAGFFVDRRLTRPVRSRRKRA